MQVISITLSLLKKPIKCLPYLMVVMCFSVLYMNAVNIGVGRDLNKFSSIHWVAVVVVPELATILILLALIRGFHDVFNIKTIIISPKNIAIYEIGIMPLFVIAYFIFFPVTFSIRHLINNLFGSYIGEYSHRFGRMLSTEAYFLYLPPVVVLGYILLNVSLVSDYLSQLADYKTKKNSEGNNQVTNTYKDICVEVKKYVTVLKVRSNVGESFLNVEGCLYFEASDHCTIVHSVEGTFKTNLSLLKLQSQLNPDIFFKNNPKYIINLAYLDSYKYTDKGQYILNFREPMNIVLTMPRSRIRNLKEAFQKHRELRLTSAAWLNKPSLAASITR